MKKNFLQDVIPPNHRRSIRDIPLPSHKEKTQSKKVREDVFKSNPQQEIKTPEFSESRNTNSPETKENIFNPQNLHSSDTYQEEEETQTYHDIPPTKPRTKRRKSGGMFKKIIAGTIVGILIFAGFMLSRTQAKVIIYPKTDTYDVEISIPTNVQNIAVATQITKSASLSLPATSEQQVEKLATGRIKIINYHAETPQELVKNTRFQTPEGLIYKIRDSISIPGYTVQNGQTVPGTLEVEVYASSAGEEYNIPKTTFTIPGFQGQSQFEKITAESVTEMTGGFIGIKKVVSEDAIEESEEQLKEQLTSQFQVEISESNPILLLPNPETISFGEVQDQVSDDTVTLTLSATVDAYSFKKEELYNFIGQNTIGGSTTSDEFSLELDTLAFSIEDEEIEILGSTVITWITDIESLKNNLAEKKRSEIATIVNSYNSFSKADIILKPFWKTKFPSNSDKIEVEIAE